jgi:hypothetical protein
VNASRSANGVMFAMPAPAGGGSAMSTARRVPAAVPDHAWSLRPDEGRLRRCCSQVSPPQSRSGARPAADRSGPACHAPPRSSPRHARHESRRHFFCREV